MKTYRYKDNPMEDITIWLHLNEVITAFTAWHRSSSR